jgi:hypothetical protein
MWSVVFSWVIIQASVAQQIFGASPYNMTSIEVGLLIGIAPLIGSLLGSGTGGIFYQQVSGQAEQWHL